jgi:hypothetical protein
MHALSVERGNDRCENGSTGYSRRKQGVDNAPNARAIGAVTDANATHLLCLDVAPITHSPNPSKYVGR